MGGFNYVPTMSDEELMGPWSKTLAAGTGLTADEFLRQQQTAQQLGQDQRSRAAAINPVPLGPSNLGNYGVGQLQNYGVGALQGYRRRY
jgi:hypothetical protein